MSTSLRRGTAPLLLCSAAEVLGLRAYSQQELLSIYVEYQLMCYIDPG